MYCQYAVLKWGWEPEQFAYRPIKSKAFVIACIQNKNDAEKQLNLKLKRK